MSQTIDLPSGTKAVYFYVEPNPFTVHDFEAIAQPGGVSTGVFQADGSGGATYVGFYATGSDTIQSITINSSADFATGEFGWNGNGGPGPSCVEEECATGLDILPGVGYPGGTVNMEVDVNNAPNDVSSFGFDVTYDTTTLEYVGPTGVLVSSDTHIGDLLQGWTMVGINVLEPGVLRIGGFTVSNAILAGDTGCMIKLEFYVLECEPTICYTVDIDDLSLADHIAGWPVCHGCLCCGCPHDGDVDENESITPQDALYAFGFYLGMLPPCDDDGVGVPEEDCLTECQQDHADVCSPVDPGSGITPVDALCIFTAYMNGLAPQDPLPCGVCD
jgi:hypothetical protein